MEEIVTQSQIVVMEKAANVVLDIESLAPGTDISSGSPKMTKALSRKGSSRTDRRNGEEYDGNEECKKLVVKVAATQPDLLKQPVMSGKLAIPVASALCSCNVTEGCEGRNKRFGRLISIHPRRVLLMFASLSSLGTLILIYFTLAMNRAGGS